MLYSLKLKNVEVFNNEIEFSMNADMRTKRFSTNVINTLNNDIVKASAIYGPNNTGKTCFIRIIENIKNAILKSNNSFNSNIHIEDTLIEIEISFIDVYRYIYSFSYDTSKKQYVFEKFSKAIKDKYNNEKMETLLEKSISSNKYFCIDKKFESRMEYALKEQMIFNAINSSDCEIFNYEIKNKIVNFASKIEIVYMVNIPINKTIELLKSESVYKKQIVDFIKYADLDLDDFKYDEDIQLIDQNKSLMKEEVLNNIPLIEQSRLISTYKGKEVPSLIYDSTGTKKIEALSSYIIEALNEGKILFIDEIDTSLHFKLTRAIISMFLNELNNKAQLIFTTHDLSLLDIKKLFRKEQIWFTDKDETGPIMYSLNKFTSGDAGIRETSDLVDMFKKGKIGAIPRPEFINSLLDIYDLE